MDAIRPLRPALLDTAATTLANAFATDPMFTWMYPDAARRASALHRLNLVVVQYGLQYGRVTESNAAKAVAIWLPPGHQRSMLGMLRFGLIGLPFGIGLRPFLRFASAHRVMSRLHAAHMPEPHWSLLTVGVDPALQRRGRGSALLKEGLVRADAHSTPAYLETSDARNLPLCERVGFKVVASTPLGAAGPTGWAMRRGAQRSIG